MRLIVADELRVRACYSRPLCESLPPPAVILRDGMELRQVESKNLDLLFSPRLGGGRRTPRPTTDVIGEVEFVRVFALVAALYDNEPFVYMYVTEQSPRAA